MRRVSVIAVALVALSAAGAYAQQQAPPSLGEVARQAEAAKATIRKAKKTYGNSDLKAVPSSAPAAPAGPAAPTEGFVSKSLGKAVPAEEVVALSEEKVSHDEVRKESEADWRQRAASMRIQIDKLQERLAALTKPNPARDANAAATSRNNIVVANLQSGLDSLTKSWARFEEAARVAKIPSAWLEPRPQFQQ